MAPASPSTPAGMSTIRRCACACGSEIEARAGAEAAAVDEHQRTPRHVAWRARGGLWVRAIDLRHVAESNAASAARFGCAA
jgi:hypothetical protein